MPVSGKRSAVYRGHHYKDKNSKREYLFRQIRKLVIEHDGYMTAYGKRLTFFIRQPFQRDHYALNLTYLRLAILLEEVTNMVVAEDGVPANSKYLAEYLEITETHFGHLRKKLMDAGILMQIFINNREMFVINPFFVFCGKEISLYLVKLFEDRNDNVYGYKLWNKLYKEVMNVNKLKKELIDNAENKKQGFISIKTKNKT